MCSSDLPLVAGDGAAVSDETKLTIAGAEPPKSGAIGRHAEAAAHPCADVLVFDLA